MLSSEHRLTKKADFERLKKSGKSHHFKYFTLSVFNRKDKLPTRVGFIVTKNVSGSSVIRNKVKRGLGEGVRQNMIYIKPGLDCVVIAHTDSARAYTADLMQAVSEAIKGAKIGK